MFEGKLLGQDFFSKDVVEVAKKLLGKIIVRKIGKKIYAGRIIETEAYGASDDAASHAKGKKTERNAPMFGPVGKSYVYLSYGNHCCLNIIGRSKSKKAGGVLIRALDPIEGIDYMIKNRKIEDLEKLANGPGKVTQAFEIDLALNNIDLTKEGPLYIVEDTEVPDSAIEATERVGIRLAKDKLWRFIFK